MKKVTSFSFLICLLFQFTSHQLSAQLTVPFKVRHQSFVKGDMTIIANNIVNRNDSFVSSNIPYSSKDYSAKHNDEMNMDYIDIDSDSETFSSSSAQFSVDNVSNLKVVYAGLYWAATYKYDKGKQKRNRKYVASDKKRTSFDVIKLKLPRQQNYQDIKGEILFDGLNENGFEDNAPYAVYADITKLLSNLENPQGNYIVANIKATVGTLSGGVSAGWTMIIVYEDQQQSGKFITTYDGFTGVNKESSDIDLNGFQTLPEGNVNLKIAGAGLEGDLGLKGDQISFKSAENSEFTILNNDLRDYNNFFNSTISVNDEQFTKRFPNSLNTLGYDSFLMKVYNPDNLVIGNNTKEATLRFKSTGDRYFMFFSAFNVEVLDPVTPVEEIKTEELLVENTILPKTTNIPTHYPTIISNETPVLEKEEIIQKSENSNNSIVSSEIAKTENIKPESLKESSDKLANNAESRKNPTPKVIAATEKQEVIQKTAKSENTKVVTKTVKKPVEKTSKIRVTPIESETRSFPGEEKGYYIIANVFARHSNATRFVSKLQALGIEAAYFINPANNYRYVYVSHHENFSDAQSLYFSDINGKYTGDLWIMTVNKENDMIVENKIENTTFAKDKAVALHSGKKTNKMLINNSLCFFEKCINYICNVNKRDS